MDEKTMEFKERKGSSITSTPVMEKSEKEAKALMKEVSQKGKGFLEDRKTAFAGQMEALANAFRQTKRELNHPDSQWMERYLEKASEGLNRGSRNLRERDVDDLMDRARRFARNQPAAFIGGAAILGFAVSRFLRSSDKHSEFEEESLASYEERSEGSSGVTASSEVPGNLTHRVTTELEEDRHGHKY